MSFTITCYLPNHQLISFELRGDTSEAVTSNFERMLLEASNNGESLQIGDAHILNPNTILAYRIDDVPSFF